MPGAGLAQRLCGRRGCDIDLMLAFSIIPVMDFADSPRSLALQAVLRQFMADLVLPSLAEWPRWFTGRVPWAAEIFNCNAPDSGTMALLQIAAAPAQARRCLDPLLSGEIGSCFAMSEPDTASSDPTQLSTRIVRDGGNGLVNGRQRFITGAAHRLCRFALVMGRTGGAGDDENLPECGLAAGSGRRRRGAHRCGRDQAGQQPIANAGARPGDAGVWRHELVARHAAGAALGRGRALRFLDGPDEVHLRTVARAELKRAKGQRGANAVHLRRWMPSPG